MIEIFRDQGPFGTLAILNMALVAIAHMSIHPLLCERIAVRLRAIGASPPGRPKTSIQAVIRFVREVASALRKHPDRQAHDLLQLYRFYWVYAYISLALFGIWIVF